MLITLQELELHPITVSRTYPPGALDYRGAEFRQLRPLQVDAVAELSGREIHITGHISTQLEAVCDRCLGRAEIPVASDFDLLYRPMSNIAREEEVEIPEDELKVGFYSGEGIELEDVVMEQVILSVPMKIVCEPECLGLCPACGINRNTGQCTCSAGHEASPFSFLKES